MQVAVLCIFVFAGMPAPRVDANGYRGDCLNDILGMETVGVNLIFDSDPPLDTCPLCAYLVEPHEAISALCSTKSFLDTELLLLDRPHLQHLKP